VEPGAAPVVYWFQLTRSASGEVKFVPHLIDDRSGVGVQITVKDVNRDDRPDGFEARHVRVSESPKTIVVSECSTGDKN
jgi:hypothetical protein